MNSKPISGVWTALATPFVESGSIDWQSFEVLIDHQIKGEVTGVVISGTTGESPTLTVQEKISLVRKARALLPSSIRVMAGSGGTNTSQSVELSKLCADAGADSLLIVTPPYNKPSPAGLWSHYSLIAESVSLPLCLYHVPGRTGQLLSANVISKLTEIPSVSSIKEASGDVALLSRIVNSTKASVLSGDDPIYLASLAVGSQGIISVISNIFPKAMVELTSAYHKRDPERALKLHQTLLPMIDMLFCESNPGPLKAALHILSLSKNILRAPMAPVTEESYQLIRSTLFATKANLQALSAL